MRDNTEAGAPVVALSPELILKLIGVGIAAAVFVDAVLVRMVLLPAVMRLLGERAWWTPRGRGQRSPKAAERSTA